MIRSSIDAGAPWSKFQVNVRAPGACSTGSCMREVRMQSSRCIPVSRGPVPWVSILIYWLNVHKLRAFDFNVQTSFVGHVLITHSAFRAPNSWQPGRRHRRLLFRGGERTSIVTLHKRHLLQHSKQILALGLQTTCSKS